MTKQKNRGVPKILPREPLTKKARAAIAKYSHHKAETKLDGYLMNHFMVDWVLEAERMRRRDLYAYLEKRGYRWRPQYGFWDRKGE